MTVVDTRTYQLLPDLTAEEYESLKAEIAGNGVRVPVDIDEDGNILDGHHRVKIAGELGLDYETRVVDGLDDQGKRSHALAVNVHRRSLTREQKRELIRASLAADPELSDVQHADRTGASDKTVAAQRRDLESTSEIPKSPKRTSADGRQRPATQQPTTHACTQCGLVTDKPAWHCQGCGSHYELSIAVCEQCNPPEASRDDHEDQLPPPPAPKPTTEPQRKKRQASRKPLPDFAKDSGWKLRQDIERVERIFTDDRFGRNKEEVTTHLRGHLQYAVETCQGLLDQLTQEGV